MLGFSSELSVIADDYMFLRSAGVICDMDMDSNFGGKIRVAHACCPFQDNYTKVMSLTIMIAFRLISPV